MAPGDVNVLRRVLPALAMVTAGWTAVAWWRDDSLLEPMLSAAAVLALLAGYALLANPRK